MVVVASAQIDPKLGQKGENLDRCLTFISEAAKEKAKLVVFPECTLTGYGFESREEAIPFSEPVPGPSTIKIVEACKKIGLYTIVGLLERVGDEVYNSTVLIGPEGIISAYRKIHLPFLGVDRFVKHGNIPFHVDSITLAKVGMAICYDFRFPESGRVLALEGAEIIALSTNWPEGVELNPDHLVRTRAYENRLFVVASNRVGVEGGVRFIGRSQIVNPEGMVLAEALPEGEEIIFASIEPAKAGEKDVINIPGVWEVYLFKDRRPDFYKAICRDIESYPSKKS